jgi:hypothetical protein
MGGIGAFAAAWTRIFMILTAVLADTMRFSEERYDDGKRKQR